MQGYRLHNSVRNKKYPRVLYVVIGVLALLLLARVVPMLFTTLSAVALSPLHELQVWLREGQTAVPYWWRDRADLITQMQSYEQSLAEVQRSTISLQLLQRENQYLRSLLGNEPDERILAGVIAAPPSVPYDLLQLDRGSLHGVIVGAPVFIGPDSVLGLITTVTDTYSIAQPFSAPNFSTTVYLVNARTFATMEGLGGGVAQVRVPQGVKLLDGEIVRIPGIVAGQFGQISHVINEPNQPEQFGFVLPLAAIRSHLFVTIGTLPVSAPTEFDFANLLATSSPLYVPLLIPATTSSSTEIE